MYEKNNLYEAYIQRANDNEFSPKLPDVTKQTTLDGINHGINLCIRWNSALDVGCGNGHYLSALSAKFKKNTGIEIDKYPEQKELEEKYKNIYFFNDKVENYPESEKFDFILLMDLFEHIPDISSFLAKISRLQENGGITYITTPNSIYCSPAEESGISAKNSGYHGHIKHYTKSEIIALMHTVGYRPEFHFYEETEIRETLRRIVKGISRRDNRWSAGFVYRVIRPLVHLGLLPVFYIIQKINYVSERANRNNPFDTRSIAIAFKKNQNI